MAWHLNPALTRFRAAVDAAWPNRDRASDGTIADAAHSATSDHQPDPDGSVDAWDMDVDGVPVERLKAAFQKHEASKYWIHAGQIASRDWGWQRRPYTGANPHGAHVHWNTRQSHENSTAPWEVDMTIDVNEVHAFLRSILEADTPAERQVRDMIRGGVQSPAGGQGLLTPLRQEVEALQADVTALREAVAGLSVGNSDVAVIRDQVADEIAERLAG
jgi:hypothetical protein